MVNVNMRQLMPKTDKNDSSHFWGYFLWDRSGAKWLVCIILPNRNRFYNYPPSSAEESEVQAGYITRPNPHGP